MNNIRNNRPSSTRAVILAGGRGTRLYPYTVALPKPLVPLGDYPILEIIIRQLAKHDFNHITLAVNHQAEIIKAFFGNGSKWNVRIDYSLEQQPLSTMGPLKNISDLPENFLVMNGDILTDLNYRAFADNHITSGNSFTISSYRRSEKVDYGVLEIDENGRLEGFKEKPESHYIVSMGIYMVNRCIVEFIPPNVSYGFDDLMHDLLQKGIMPCVLLHRGSWLDIGRPDDYRTASEQFKSSESIFLR